MRSQTRRRFVRDERFIKDGILQTLWENPPELDAYTLTSAVRKAGRPILGDRATGDRLFAELEREGLAEEGERPGCLRLTEAGKARVREHPRAAIFWTTAEGEQVPLEALTDLHLTNIMQLCYNRGWFASLSVPAEEFAQDRRADFVDHLIEEAMSRSLPHPWP